MSVNIKRKDSIAMAKAFDAEHGDKEVTARYLLTWMQSQLPLMALNIDHARSFAADSGIALEKAGTGIAKTARAQLVAVMLDDVMKALGHDRPAWWDLLVEGRATNDEINAEVSAWRLARKLRSVS